MSQVGIDTGERQGEKKNSAEGGDRYMYAATRKLDDGRSCVLCFFFVWGGRAGTSIAYTMCWRVQSGASVVVYKSGIAQAGSNVDRIPVFRDNHNSLVVRVVPLHALACCCTFAGDSANVLPNVAPDPRVDVE